MSDNRLGTTPDGGPLSVDIERLIGSHACIVANSGGGKSGLIRRLNETTHGAVQQIILDAEDEFYTLRERFDYVIAGGDGGDVPATVANAESLALGALTHGFSLIVQLNDLGFDGAPEFIGRFLTALVNAPRDLWHKVLVVVDEAQRFVPRLGETAATAGIKDLISRGRKRGFTAVLAGTKFTEIDPAVRGSINNWMLGRVGQAVDRNTMAEQLGFTRGEAREKLRGIEPRWFWAMGPALAREPVFFHVDDVETTPVHAGQAKVPTPPPPEALRAILQGLAAPVAEAEVDGNSRTPTAAPSWPDQRKEVTALRGANSALEGALKRAGRLVVEMDGLLQEAHKALTEIPITLGEPAPAAAPRTAGEKIIAGPNDAIAHAEGRALPKEHRARVTKPAPEGGSAPSPAALAIVDLLDRINPARVTWTQAATMTGRKASGGNFNSARKWLRESGRIVEDGEFIRSASDAPAGLSRDEAVDLWKSVLTNPAPRMIDALAASPLHPEELADKLGVQPRGGNWNNGLAQLRRNGVAELVGGEWRLCVPLPGEA